MTRHSVLALVIVLAFPASTLAQSARVEVSVFGGWTLADGVTTDTAVVSGDGNIYNRIDPKDSFNF